MEYIVKLYQEFAYSGFKVIEFPADWIAPSIYPKLE
jgi:hypothetical protein